MRIAEMHVTPIALGDPPLLNAAGLHAPWCLRTVVELVADNGLRGLAEVPGSAATNAKLEAARDVALGRDPLDWHGLRAALRERFGTEASAARGDKPWDQRALVQVESALDVACLDLAGHAFEVPVATLLGGIVRERVPYSAYLFYKYEGAGGELAFGTNPAAKGWDAGRQRAALDPDGIVAQARAMCREFGFQSLKLKGGVFEPAQEVAALKALRAAFGPGVPIRYDPNALWTVDTSIKWGRQLEDVLEYFEDPARGQEGMAAVRRAVKLPLATNMCTTSFAELPGSVRTSSEDIILTDHHFWGGLRAAMELAAHCRIFSRGVSMHSNNHAGISLAAMTHLGAAMPNLGYALDTHYPWQWEEIVTGGRIKFEDGCVVLPKKPGLGVELDRAALARAHEAFKRCGLTERNDEIEMQKKIPGWKFAATRW
ncbi:MAG TPA: enolase C-terminal domain-like protein [Opitutaceae bacterium]|nr:enolase C-terminal domain-like protein [Opitutaceae bacterium]